MKNSYTLPIKVAVLTFPFLAMFITAPIFNLLLSKIWRTRQTEKSDLVFVCFLLVMRILFSDLAVT